MKNKFYNFLILVNNRIHQYLLDKKYNYKEFREEDLEFMELCAELFKEKYD